MNSLQIIDKSNKIKVGRSLITILPILALFSNLIAFPSQAQTASIPQPSTAALELNLLKPNAQPSKFNVLTFDTISQTGVTVPSLWWAKEQFAGKLLNNWLAYPQERRIDLVVNRQLWALLDYMGRYSFVNHFGTISRDYGYNLRVFIVNQPQTPLATYTCNFSNTQPICNINFESSGRDSFGIPSKN